MRDLNPAFLTSKPQLSPSQVMLLCWVWVENLDLGALLSCRAEAGEGELLCCPSYPHGHSDGCTQGLE